MFSKKNQAFLKLPLNAYHSKHLENNKCGIPFFAKVEEFVEFHFGQS